MRNCLTHYACDCTNEKLKSLEKQLVDLSVASYYLLSHYPTPIENDVSKCAVAYRLLDSELIHTKTLIKESNPIIDALEQAWEKNR